MVTLHKEKVYGDYSFITISANYWLVKNSTTNISLIMSFSDSAVVLPLCIQMSFVTKLDDFKLDLWWNGV